jgi:hypothetical protein
MHITPSTITVGTSRHFGWWLRSHTCPLNDSEAAYQLFSTPLVFRPSLLSLCGLAFDGVSPVGLCGRWGVFSIRYSAASRRTTVSSSE